MAYAWTPQFLLTPKFFGDCGFNTLIQKYLSEEWKQIYQASFKSKTTEGNSDTIYFP